MPWHIACMMHWRDSRVYDFTQKVESNQLFLTMPRPQIDYLLQSYFFYFWNEEADEIRLVTSFDTTQEDIDAFIALLYGITAFATRKILL